jgi:hypothetical protein
MISYLECRVRVLSHKPAGAPQGRADRREQLEVSTVSPIVEFLSESFAGSEAYAKTSSQDRSINTSCSTRTNR